MIGLFRCLGGYLCWYERDVKFGGGEAYDFGPIRDSHHAREQSNANIPGGGGSEVYIKRQVIGAQAAKQSSAPPEHHPHAVGSPATYDHTTANLHIIYRTLI